VYWRYPDEASPTPQIYGLNNQSLFGRGKSVNKRLENSFEQGASTAATGLSVGVREVL
jgi:hypothetical protein